MMIYSPSQFLLYSNINDRGLTKFINILRYSDEDWFSWVSDNTYVYLVNVTNVTLLNDAQLKLELITKVILW